MEFLSKIPCNKKFIFASLRAWKNIPWSGDFSEYEKQYGAKLGEYGGYIMD